MLNRRLVLGLSAIALPVVAAFGYAAQTGRIDILTPVLPEDGDLPPIPGVIRDGAAVPGIARAAFFEDVSLLNVWASWCPQCRIEHPELMRLAERPGIRLFGIAADDTEANAARYLAEHGNPFSRLSLDADRVYQRALKHRGIPQTYVFRRDGMFIDKITGELTPELVAGRLQAAIARATAAPGESRPPPSSRGA